MSEEQAVRAALHELTTADVPRICRCMHVIAGGGAWLTAADILTMLEALSANEAPFALSGEDFPDLQPLFRSVAGLDRIWRSAPERVRTAFAVHLVKAGVMPVGEIGEAIVAQAAVDFLNDGSVDLTTFAETDLLDRIARGVSPERYTYSGAFASYFAVCSPGQAELVIQGVSNPELLANLLAASPFTTQWIATLVEELASRASTPHEWCSVLCAVGALVTRGEALSPACLRALDSALPHACDAKRADELFTLLPPERRSALLARQPDWLLVRPPLAHGAMARLGEELLAGRVHEPFDEGAFGARALAALVRLGADGLTELTAISPGLEQTAPSRFLITEARHLQSAAGRPRTGPLARERDLAAVALFTDERAGSEPWDALWAALWPNPLAIVPPELHSQLAAFDVVHRPGSWLAATPDHPIFAAIGCKDAYERMVELNAPALLRAFHEASFTGAERGFAAAPRRDELRYLNVLPLGYRRALELVRLTRVRLARAIELPPSLLARLDVTIDRARTLGPRMCWPEQDEEEELACDERARSAVFELERVVHELGLRGSRDGQSRHVEVGLAYALLWAVEQGDPPGRRAIARQWIEDWLDQDVVAAATAFA